MTRVPSTSRLMKRLTSHIESTSSEECLRTKSWWNSATSLCYFISQFLKRYVINLSVSTVALVNLINYYCFYLKYWIFVLITNLNNMVIGYYQIHNQIIIIDNNIWNVSTVAVSLTEEEISNIDAILPNNLKHFVGTMKVHQYSWN